MVYKKYIPIQKFTDHPIKIFTVNRVVGGHC